MAGNQGEAKRSFWDGVRESARAVQAGPEWMRAGIVLNDEHFVTYTPKRAHHVTPAELRERPREVMAMAAREPVVLVDDEGVERLRLSVLSDDD